MRQPLGGFDLVSAVNGTGLLLGFWILEAPVGLYNDARSIGAFTTPVHPAHALHERIPGCALGDHRVEVPVDAGFHALRRDDECRLAIIESALHGVEDLLAIQRTHAPCYEEELSVQRPSALCRRSLRRLLVPIDGRADSVRDQEHTRRVDCREDVLDSVVRPAHGLWSGQTRDECGVVAILWFEAEAHRRCLPGRCGAELYDLAARSDAPYGFQVLQASEGVQERPGEVGFVQQKQRVLTDQACLDGTHARRHAVAAEEKPRTDLVNGGGDYLDLIR